MKDIERDIFTGQRYTLVEGTRIDRVNGSVLITGVFGNRVSVTGSFLVNLEDLAERAD
jgi:hypothetical protein